MAQKVFIRNGTAAEWVAANPVLSQSEMGHENDTNLFKFGDGVTAWNDLGYYEHVSKSDMTYYVDSVNGSDANDGLTAGTPFVTISKAITKIPTTLNHIYTINVLSGTYNENIAIEQIKGKGNVILNGSSIADKTRILNGYVTFKYCNVRIDLKGFNILLIPGDYGSSIMALRCLSIWISKCVIDVTRQYRYTISITDHSKADVRDCVISNSTIDGYVCIAREFSYIYCSNNSGTNNVVAYGAFDMGYIRYTGTTPTYTGAKTAVGRGGVIST